MNAQTSWAPLGLGLFVTILVGAGVWHLGCEVRGWGIGHADQVRRREQLERDGAIVLGLVQERTRLTRELVAGRMTLREAAAEFGRLNATRPLHFPAISFVFPGATPEECLCRHVIRYASVEVYDQPDAAAIVGALEKQFDDYLREMGRQRRPCEERGAARGGGPGMRRLPGRGTPYDVPAISRATLAQY